MDDQVAIPHHGCPKFDPWWPLGAPFRPTPGMALPQSFSFHSGGGSKYTGPSGTGRSQLLTLEVVHRARALHLHREGTNG
jgi:hypothetical protein